MPLTATISPARSDATAAPRASSPDDTSSPVGRRQASAGPQAGQAFGWAWKRRSPGSSYSAWHGAHIANRAIVVAARSYGTDSTIV